MAQMKTETVFPMNGGQTTTETVFQMGYQMVFLTYHLWTLLIRFLNKMIQLQAQLPATVAATATPT